MMTMPKASVHKQYTVPRWKNDVRFSRQVCCMKAITIAKTKQKSAYCSLCRSFFHPTARITAVRCTTVKRSIRRFLLLIRKNYQPITAVLLVMVDITKCDEVFSGVFSLLYVVLSVMKFKHLSRYPGEVIDLFHITLDAPKSVSLQHSDPHRFQVFFGRALGLSILFKRVHSDIQIFAIAIFVTMGHPCSVLNSLTRRAHSFLSLAKYLSSSPVICSPTFFLKY